MIIKKKPVAIFCFALLLGILPFMGLAQYLPNQGGDPDLQEEENEEPQAPIDGGISLLLAAGAAYGAKKCYELNKHRKR